MFCETVRAMRTIDREIARLNIKHFRRVLTQEMDSATRQAVLRVLVEEQEKLAKSDKPYRRRHALHAPWSSKTQF